VEETNSNGRFMAYKHKIDSTVSIASMISNIERVDMGVQALSSAATNICY